MTYTVRDKAHFEHGAFRELVSGDLQEVNGGFLSTFDGFLHGFAVFSCAGIGGTIGKAVAGAKWGAAAGPKGMVVGGLIGFTVGFIITK